MSAMNARQGILSLALKDKPALYSAYMPFVKGGGIFVPTPKRYMLGDEVFLLLTLPDSSERLPVAGKVIWTTPAGAQGNRAAGIGVQFPDGPEGEAVRNKIETLLAGLTTSDKPTLRCKRQRRGKTAARLAVEPLGHRGRPVRWRCHLAGVQEGK